LGWWTFLPVLIVAYTFFGLDALGRQLEEPFSAAPNALPIYSMQRTIETELMSTLALTAVDHESVQQPGREG
jgi:putative membrane protein